MSCPPGDEEPRKLTNLSLVYLFAGACLFYTQRIAQGDVMSSGPLARPDIGALTTDGIPTAAANPVQRPRD